MEDLIEAYLSVYESSHLETDMKKRAEDNEKARKEIEDTEAHKEMAKTAAKKFDESTESYDVVLEYLMNEGFADTEQNAITIMANMSEAWIDEILDEAQIMSVSGPGGLKHMINPNVLKLQNAAARERQERQAKTKRTKDSENTKRFQQTAKKSIERLNAKPGEDSGDYDSGYYGDDDTSDGKRHYSLSRTNRADRQRRAKG